MDRACLSYSRATQSSAVTVVTETCHLFLSAMEESLELVLTFCHFVATLQSLEYIVLAL